MKLPLWCKDRAGKYRRFPYEQLQTLPDGRLGLPCLDSGYPGYPNCLGTYEILRKLCEETGWDSGHFFSYSAYMDAYVLREEPDR